MKKHLSGSYKKSAINSGFTLIEMSIVLVIIGLIVGGILTGMDLKRTAEQRATITQIERYNTAVNTFRNKFGYLPGDMPYTNVNGFGLSGVVLDQGGDGNGLIASTTAGVDVDWFINEPVLFWTELSASGLIDGTFGTAIGAEGQMTSNITSTNTANAYMPPAKIGHGNSVNVASGNGYNYWLISGFGGGASGIIYGGDGIYGAQANFLTPMESFNMDKKVDDGMPGSGFIWAMDTTTYVLPLAESAIMQSSVATPAPLATCATGSPLSYVISATAANNQTCSLRLKFN